MRLGLILGYAARKLELPIERVREADRLAVHIDSNSCNLQLTYSK